MTPALWEATTDAVFGARPLAPLENSCAQVLAAAWTVVRVRCCVIVNTRSTRCESQNGG